jgi:hypothetical protein
MVGRHRNIFGDGRERELIKTVLISGAKLAILRERSKLPRFLPAGVISDSLT